MENKTKLILSFVLTSAMSLLFLWEFFQENVLYFFRGFLGEAGGLLAYLILIIIIGQSLIVKTTYPFWAKVGIMFIFLILELCVFVAVFLQALENAF